MESEDEDCFPVSSKHKSNLNLQKPKAEAEQKEKKATEKTKKKKKAKDGDHDTGLKRKVESVDQDDLPEMYDGSTHVLYLLILALNFPFFFFWLECMLFLLLTGYHGLVCFWRRSGVVLF